MKIAVATTDGVNVNQHFGKTDEFYIYDVKDGDVLSIERKKCIPLSENNPNHQHNADKFKEIVDVLSGVDFVYSRKIGDVPLQKLGENNILHEKADGKIVDIINQL